MHALLQPLFILVLFVAVHATDITISSATSRSTVQAICYGIVALLAIICVVMSLFGL